MYTVAATAAATGWPKISNFIIGKMKNKKDI